MSDRCMCVGVANKFRNLNGNSRRLDDSEAVVGGPMVAGCRPVAAFGSVAALVPTGRGGGHCAVGQPSVDRGADLER